MAVLPRMLGAVALCLALAVPADAVAQETVDLIVGRDPGLSAAQRADVRADAGVRLDRILRVANAEVVTVPAAEADQALAELKADPDVRWAQRDGIATTQAVTTDPYFGDLWGLQNTGQTVEGVAGTADADMDVTEAWALSTGAGQTVAVVDTGVDAAHPELAGQLATNPGEQGTDGLGADRRTNGVDDDANGLIDDWRGYDFAYDDGTPDDVHGHGSHVAGTIAAANGNATGITGTAPDARILPLKALDDTGSGFWSDIAEAFDYAGDRGVDVVNASLGAAGSVPAITQVTGDHPNTLYVVAAGNDGVDLDTSTYFPCEAPQANVLCIGASDNLDQPASFSNYSPTAVDVFAPGVSVRSSTFGDYDFMDGTSMAAPHVAAEAALLYARKPALSVAEARQAIMTATDDKPALAEYGQNGARANANAAMLAVDNAPDGDGDTVPDSLDNCPATANAGQADGDGDGAGDACDARPAHDDRDDDADGVANGSDNCPSVANAGQSDRDADGKGDVCDPTPDGADNDGDGFGVLVDNCPAHYNPDQDDADDDGTGDPCDPTPYGTQIDDGNGADGDTPVSDAPLAWTPPNAPGGALRPGRGLTPATIGPGLTPTGRVRVGRIRVRQGRLVCRRGRCGRTLRVAVSAPGAKRVALTAVRGRRGRRVKVTRRTRLAAGRWRLTATATGRGGTARRTVTVIVRGR